MPINVPALITNTGNESALFGTGGGGPAGGVSTLNGLEGAVSVASSASVASSVSGQTISLSTAGLPQVPSSVAATGNVKGATITSGTATAGVAGSITAQTSVISPIFAGAGLGNQLPSVPAGSGYIGQQGNVQGLNFVIGGIRIQGGFFNTTYDSGTTINSATLPLSVPFVATSTPLVYVQNVGAAINVVAVQSASATTLNFSCTGTQSQQFYWLAIGSA